MEQTNEQVKYKHRKEEKSSSSVLNLKLYKWSRAWPFSSVMTDKTDLARPYHYEPYPAKPNNASSLKRNEIKTSSNASSLIHNPTKHKSERSSKCCCCTISSRSATFWTSFLTNLGICTLLFGYTLLGEFWKKETIWENCSLLLPTCKSSSLPTVVGCRLCVKFPTLIREMKWSKWRAHIQIGRT